MFEKHRRGINPISDVLADGYERLRALARAVDDMGAMAIDDVRRRRRKVERIERLDQSLTETINVLSEIQVEVAEAPSDELANTKSQLQWILSTLRS